jgi:hypothetical protein
MNWVLIEQLIMQLLPAAIQAISTVQKATGTTPQAATAAVVDHLTPGAPSAPSLGPSAPAPKD